MVQSKSIIISFFSFTAVSTPLQNKSKQLQNCEKWIQNSLVYPVNSQLSTSCQIRKSEYRDFLQLHQGRIEIKEGSSETEIV
jgi:hypothetical protein